MNSESQGLGSVDPLLIISEPPDLKNWFSSYEYQSPELNTADGLEGCDGLVVNDSEDEEEVSFVEDSINVKCEDFVEQKFSEDDWKSSEEVGGNGFSEEGSFVQDSLIEKDENLGVLEDLGGLNREECDEGDTCVEDSIKLEGENLGEIGGLDSFDFVGCGGYEGDCCSEEETYVEDSIKQKVENGGYKGDSCSEEDTYVEDSIKLKVEKSGVFGELGNAETFVHDKVVSEGFVGCDKSNENDDTNQVADMSDTLNFSSEPPDIMNWFSSYAYESPALDTSDEFRLSSYEESKTTQAGLHIGMSMNSKDENVIGTTIIQNNDASIGKKMASTGFVRTSSSVEDNRQVQKNWQGINSSTTNNLPLRGISQPVLESSLAPDSEAVSIKDVEFLDQDKREITRKQKRKFPQNDSQKPFGVLKSLGNEESSPRKSFNRRDYVQKGSGGKARSDNDMFVSPRSNLDFIASRGSSSRTDMSNDKRNCAESEIISARKKSSLREYDENSLIRPPPVHCQSSSNGVKISSVSNKAENLNRRALTDTTNTQPSEDVPEVAGKWRCPQKSKPNRGPPMKQLGLERWVRRL